MKNLLKSFSLNNGRIEIKFVFIATKRLEKKIFTKKSQSQRGRGRDEYINNV